MTGGASPLIAAEYQMIIFWIICATSSTAIYVALSLASKHAAIDKYHRLTSDKILKKVNGKIDIDVAIVKELKTLFICAYASMIQAVCERSVSTTVASSSSTDTTSDNSKIPANRKEGVSVLVNISKSTKKKSAIKESKYELVEMTEDDDLATSKESVEFHEGNGIVTYEWFNSDHKLNKTINNEELPLFELKNINILSNKLQLFDHDGLSIKLSLGERVSIQGPSGLGKTRLLRVIHFRLS